MRALPAVAGALFLAAPWSAAQRQGEQLGRGVVALRTSSTQVYVSWRLLGHEPAATGFNVYRSTNGAAAVKLNATPVTQTSDFLDNLEPVPESMVFEHHPKRCSCAHLQES